MYLNPGWTQLQTFQWVPSWLPKKVSHFPSWKHTRRVFSRPPQHLHLHWRTLTINHAVVSSLVHLIWAWDQWTFQHWWRVRVPRSELFWVLQICRFIHLCVFVSFTFIYTGLLDEEDLYYPEVSCFGSYWVKMWPNVCSGTVGREQFHRSLQSVCPEVQSLKNI